jgi:hypothetical protein
MTDDAGRRVHKSRATARASAGTMGMGNASSRSPSPSMILFACTTWLSRSVSFVFTRVSAYSQVLVISNTHCSSTMHDSL